MLALLRGARSNFINSAESPAFEKMLKASDLKGHYLKYKQSAIIE